MPYQTITAHDAEKLIEKGNLTIIDVRGPDEFAGAHIKNAINIDLRSPNFMSKIEELNKDANYLVYCLSGHRSKQAVTIMDSLGFKHVYTISGGIQSWTAAGYSLVK